MAQYYAAQFCLAQHFSLNQIGSSSLSQLLIFLSFQQLDSRKQLTLTLLKVLKNKLNFFIR